MKNKKTVIWIVLIICLLAAALLIWKGCGDAGHGGPSSHTSKTDLPQGGESGENGAGSESGENGNGGESGEGGASIIEDGGDVVIVIPDDQESGGL